MSMSFGALPRQIIESFCSAGFILNADQQHISPASLDLQLSDEVYRVERVLRPGPGAHVADLLPAMEAQLVGLDEPLRKGALYLIKLQEECALPPDYQGYCNPKSSTGRLDVHVRVLADGVYEYDTIPKGYHGPLWLFFTSKSFGIKVSVGEKLAQLRLIKGKSRFSQTKMETVFATTDLAWSTGGKRKLKLRELQQVEDEGGLHLSLYFPRVGDIFGYRCIASADRVLDLSARDVPPEKFFVPEEVRHDAFIQLVANRFYILSSAEWIRIPREYAAEMVAVHERIGEHRSHYAGFLDPGWGCSGKGRPFTLEVRSPEVMCIRRGQPMARIVYESMMEPPDIDYDGLPTSNYGRQALPQLAKQFAPWSG